MTTREEIDAAEHRLERALDRGVWDSGRVGEYRSGKASWLADCALVARFYLSERAERQPRIEAAAKEITSMFIEEPKQQVAELIGLVITRCLNGETT